MKRLAPTYTVFVSSTARDLAAHRAAARDVLLELQWQPLMMEYFETGTRETVAECLALVERADLLVLVVGARRGWVPTTDEGGDGESSITELEYRHATEVCRIPALALFSSLPEEAEAGAETATFRARINRVAKFFDADADRPVADFATKLRASLTEHKARMLEARQRRALRLGNAGLAALLALAAGVAAWLRVDAEMACAWRTGLRIAIGALLLAAAGAGALLAAGRWRQPRRGAAARVAVSLVATALACWGLAAGRSDGCDTDLVSVRGVVTGPAGAVAHARVVADGYDFGEVTNADGSFAGHLPRASLRPRIVFRVMGDGIQASRISVTTERSLRGDVLDLGAIEVTAAEKQ